MGGGAEGFSAGWRPLRYTVRIVVFGGGSLLGTNVRKGGKFGSVISNVTAVIRGGEGAFFWPRCVPNAFLCEMETHLKCPDRTNFFSVFSVVANFQGIGNGGGGFWQFPEIKKLK